MSRKEKKKGGCLKNLVTFMFVIVIMAAFSGDSDSTTKTSSSNSASSSKETKAAVVTEAPTAIPTAAPTSTPEPSTPEEWAERAIRIEYGDDLISVEWEEVDQGKMISINCVFADNWTKALRRDMFMFHAKDIFRELTTLLNEGKTDFDLVYIHGRTTFVDQYGKEFDGDAMQICMAADDLKQIVWENMLIDMLPKIAKTYAVHPALRD